MKDKKLQQEQDRAREREGRDDGGGGERNKAKNKKRRERGEEREEEDWAGWRSMRKTDRVCFFGGCFLKFIHTIIKRAPFSIFHNKAHLEQKTQKAYMLNYSATK